MEQLAKCFMKITPKNSVQPFISILILILFQKYCGINILIVKYSGSNIILK